MSDFKINIDALKKQLQPAIEKVGLEHVQKLAVKLFTAEERGQLTIKIVAGKVQATGPQELIDRLHAELDKK